MQFCGQCGASLPAQVNFCPRCGTPVAASTLEQAAAPLARNAPPQHLEMTVAAFSDEQAAAALPGNAPQQPATRAANPSSPDPRGGSVTSGHEPGAPQSRSRRFPLIVASLMAVLVVAASATWWAVTGSDGDRVTSLPQAVTSEPDLDWSWSAPDDIGAVVADDETTYALTAGSLFALDGDGREMWEVEVDDAAYVNLPDERQDLLWLSGPDTGASLRSVEDGDEVFSTEGDIETVLEDSVIVSEEDEVRSIGLASGKVEWATETADDVAVDGDSVLMLGDGQLRRLTQDGDERWAADVDLSLGENPYITVGDDFLVVNGQNEAAAFARDDGAELWNVDTGDDGGVVGLMFPDQVYIQKNDFSFEDDSDDTRVVIYDRDGRVASMDPENSFFFAYPVRSEGKLYAFDFGGGVLYDQDYKPLGRDHDGSVQPASGGLYELSEGQVAFFRYDESSAVWTLGDEFGDDAQLRTADNRLLIADGSDLLTYK
jgi:outer membrane protein assembly factor BamB